MEILIKLTQLCASALILAFGLTGALLCLIRGNGWDTVAMFTAFSTCVMCFLVLPSTGELMKAVKKVSR